MTIPARDSTRAVKIRPREVREWLDDLPYLDLERAARLAHQQLRVINRQSLAPGARLEIMTDFLAAYQRLNESPPATAGAAETTGQLLKRLSLDIGFGYKIVVHELANARARLLDGRNLSLSLLGAMHTLGTQLVHYYASYRRAPRALWNECLALYRFARARGRHTCSASLPGVGDVQLDSVFRLIALLRHANPYGLAPGMALALQRYLSMHAQLSSMETGSTVTDAGPSICLTGPDNRTGSPAEDDLRIDVTALLEKMAADISTLQRHKQASSVGLPAELPGSMVLNTLRQLLKDWESPRNRGKDREAAHATIELAVGLESCYCVLNNGRGFDPALFLAAGHEDAIDLGGRPAPEGRAVQQQAAGIPCQSINRSTGGVALSHRGQSDSGPRVGQLVALRRAGTAPAGGWVLAVCRWLVEPDTGKGFDVGVQYLAHDARPVVIRPAAATGRRGDYQPALSTHGKHGDQSLRTLLVHSGVVVPGESVNVYEQGKQYSLHCVELLESGPGFERFVCLQQA